MKSHSHQNSLKPSEQEIFAEADSLEGSPVPEARLPAPVRTPVSFDAMFLMFLGCGSLVLGLVLCLGPKLSWKLNQIADGFKYLGVQGGVLVMGVLLTELILTRTFNPNEDHYGQAA